MNYNSGMYQNYTIEGSADINISKKDETEYNKCFDNSIPGIVCTPIMECPIEKCIHREIIHEVPHVQPINTRIINHHIYKHTYSPSYTCTEENEVCNVNECCSKKIM